MNIGRLLDRQSYGLGVAARYIGDKTDAYRPRGLSEPLKPENRYLRMPAAFVSEEGGSRRANGYGTSEWRGIFDSSYTKPGDYLVQGERIFFIAAQQPLLPVLCILTNRTISITRPSVQSSTASNPYGGYTVGATSLLINHWPASVLGINGKGEPAAGLPTDEIIPYLAVLLPGAQDALVSPGDLLSDDIGRNATLITSELSELGWRLTAKLATN